MVELARAGLPQRQIVEVLAEEGLAEVGGLRINISGCTNSCGQHHIADIGFFGAERRAHGEAAPGYQMLLGGHVGQATAVFGDNDISIERMLQLGRGEYADVVFVTHRAAEQDVQRAMAASASCRA